MNQYVTHLTNERGPRAYFDVIFDVMEKTYEWTDSGRESLLLKLTIEAGEIQSVEMKSKGCMDFLLLSQKMKSKLIGAISDLLPPTGADHSSIIWREMVARIQDTWSLPVEHAELCHCRKISTEKVDRSIVYGAHSVEEVRNRTSANTGCGTCKEDVQAMINNRLKVK